TVDVKAVLASGGTAALEGTVHPGTLEARARAALTHGDVAPFATYMPPEAGVTLTAGRVSGRQRVTHDRAAGARANGRLRVADMELVRRDQPGTVVRDSRVDFALRDVILKDGAFALREATVSGTPRITEASGG